MRKIHLIGFGLFFTALGLMLGIYKFQKPSSYSMDIRQDHDPNVLGGDFSLTDQHGKRRSIHEFKGKYMLIYFGYTYCPDICPMGLTNITKALKLLERNRDDVIPIFITVDPTRDTPENLQLYAQNFHPNYVMLTGTEAEIETTKKAYQVYAKRSRQAETKTTDYLIDHSTLVYLMDRNGGFVRMFPHNTEPEKIASYINEALVKDMKQ